VGHCRFSNGGAHKSEGPADLVEQSDSRVLTPFYAGTLANIDCNFKLERMVFKASASTIDPFSVGNSHDLGSKSVPISELLIMVFCACATLLHQSCRALPSVLECSLYRFQQSTRHLPVASQIRHQSTIVKTVRIPTTRKTLELHGESEEDESSFETPATLVTTRKRRSGL
jgi:hypothetical protein